MLRPTGVKLSVDVFGFSAFYSKRNPEGQDVDDMALRLDALSPMNYPSHFGAGFYTGPGRTWRILEDCAAVLKGRLEAAEYVALPPPDIRPESTPAPPAGVPARCARRGPRTGARAPRRSTPRPRSSPSP